MDYFTPEGKFRYKLLSHALTNPDFQDQLKLRFAQAHYNILHSGERALISSRVDQYLSQLQGEDYRFASTILSQTVYVPFDELLSELKRMTEEFLLQIGTQPYYIVLNNRKFASMALMLIKVYPLLQNSNFLFTTFDSTLPQNSHALIVDDASYSGNNLEGIIDELTFNNDNLTVHVLIPYMARFMYQHLSKTFQVHFYQPNLFLYMNEYLEENNLQQFSDEIYARFNAIENLELHAQLPLYFDHAVASKDSSYPTIYLQGIIPDRGYFGKLIAYEPDQTVRQRVYDEYFDGLLPPTM